VGFSTVATSRGNSMFEPNFYVCPTDVDVRETYGKLTKKSVSDVNLLGGSYRRVTVILSIPRHVNAGRRYRLIAKDSS
jgi:hypothetical protein